ncbi:hypothetical protein BH09BAC6_BH09BAC6_06930 [soil metagenome]
MSMLKICSPTFGLIPILNKSKIHPIKKVANKIG